MGRKRITHDLVTKQHYWNVANLQHFVSFSFVVEWFNYIYIYNYIYYIIYNIIYLYIFIIYLYILYIIYIIYILFSILFHYRLLQDIEWSSLCYTVGPCSLSVLWKGLVLIYDMVEASGPTLHSFLVLFHDRTLYFLVKILSLLCCLVPHQAWLTERTHPYRVSCNNFQQVCKSHFLLWFHIDYS